MRTEGTQRVSIIFYEIDLTLHRICGELTLDAEGVSEEITKGVGGALSGNISCRFASRRSLGTTLGTNGRSR